MAQFNIDRQLARDLPGTLHAGIDLDRRQGAHPGYAL
jgi:hypothetical protein